ncbi:MAG: bifunctional riboflavin kinase/FAD synthetase [Bacteroidia bacterium]
MRIFNSIEEVPEFKETVLTLGTFDGVHLGHQKIIKRLSQVADEKGGESVLLTFWPHPRMVLQGDDNSLKLLNTIEEKTRLLEKAGLQNLIIAPFTLAFSRMSYLEFVREILVNTLHTKHLIIGHDHHFGKNREGSYEQLLECAPVYDFSLEQVEALEVDNITISSSKIRTALQEGNIERANHFLGYSYMVNGEVVKGFQRGRELGFPTANVKIPENYKLLPADGIYVVALKCLGKSYKGMASLGYNPTFSYAGKTLEVNIFDFNEDLYGEKIEVSFLAFIRKEAKFADVPALIKQINADKAEALKFFSNL